jgi:methyl-accepting chemotaxis protein
VMIHLTTSRRKFLIHLLLAAIGSTAIFALIIAAAIFAPLIARMQSGVPSSSEMLVLADRMLTLHARYWPVVFMSLAAVCVSSLLLFERMTAPLVRFLRCFQSITNGEVPNPIHIRRGDYLVDESNCLNTMMASLGVFLNDLRDQSDAIHGVLAELIARNGDRPSEHLAVHIAQLEALDKSLHDVLARFRKAPPRSPSA